MLTLHMAVQVGPSQASHIAISFRTVIAEQQNGILEDLVILILNSQIVVLARKVFVGELFKAFCMIVGEDNVVRLSLYQRNHR